MILPRTSMNKKVGIFGGSFNPPHSYHFLLARTIWKACKFDEIWMVPLFNPNKDPAEYVSPEHIDKMLKLGSWNYSKFIKPIPSGDVPSGCYTSTELIEHFSSLHPDTEFWWIMGSDGLWSLPKWNHWKKLLDPSLRVVIFQRVGYNPFFAPLEVISELQKVYTEDTLVFVSSSDTNVEVSSSLIRNNYKKGDTRSILSTQYFLPYKVREYIESHGLYLPNK